INVFDIRHISIGDVCAIRNADLGIYYGTISQVGSFLIEINEYPFIRCSSIPKSSSSSFSSSFSSSSSALTNSSSSSSSSSSALTNFSSALTNSYYALNNSSSSSSFSLLNN